MATATAMLAENKHLFIGVLLNLDGAGNGCVDGELTGERVATFMLNITFSKSCHTSSSAIRCITACGSEQPYM
jgi:hypothetical protein